MGARRKRRSWSDDEKREICQQTIASGVSVAQVAHRYAMNANMIHNWLKDARFAPPEVDPCDMVDEVPFLEVALPLPNVPNAIDTARPATGSALADLLSAMRVDISLWMIVLFWSRARHRLWLSLVL